jgi:peptidyl-prolyl cis-trans isomerase B (cyclophilin B)
VHVPTNEQRRQTAKRKLERQLARRAERAKRRKTLTVILTVVGVVAAVGIVYWLANIGGSDQTAAASNTSSPTETTPATPAKTSTGPCKFTETPQEPSPKPAGMPDDPADTPKTGTVKVNLKTDQGDIPLVMDRAKAPCTVLSMEHLVKQKFFDATKCHRLTTTKGLQVLQCGDPQGTGQGGPGYTIPDEKPKDLKPGPAANGTQTVIYPRGTLAMANTGQPNSGGSQFFMVWGDTTLPGDYTVFGTIDAPGLTVLDKVAAAGVDPAGSTDGAPKLPVNIASATLAS